MDPLRSSLTTLEGKDWGDPTEESRLVRECHRLRNLPLRDLSIEDLRILIGQGIGLVHLIPLAIGELEKNPWCEGDFYPGDLLKCVVAADPNYWSEHPDSMVRMQRVIDRIEESWAFFQREVKPNWLKVFGGNTAV